MKALIGLGNCSMKLQMYEVALKFFKKGLQYAWLNNDLEIENQVYGKLGVCYYYLGDIEKVKHILSHSQQPIMNELSPMITRLRLPPFGK
jgi:tetratricopeptide (TPR) repeat protein